MLAMRVRRETEAEVPTRGRLFHCTRCLFSTRHIHRLCTHVDNAHVQRVVTCDFCRKTFTNQLTYWTHVRDKHRTATSARGICEHCGKEFGCRRYLLRHIRTVHRSTRTFCATCDVNFSSSEALKDHCQKRHSPPEHEKGKADAKEGESGLKGVCSSCGKCFAIKQMLLQHEKSCHGVPYRDLKNMEQREAAKRISCTQCGRRFTSAAGLYQHQRNKSCARSVICDKCGAVVTRFSEGCEHIPSYESARPPIRCEVCGKAWLSRLHLKQHMKSHEKPSEQLPRQEKQPQLFNCDLCKKTFKSATNLTSHRKRFHCEIPVKECGEGTECVSRETTTFSCHMCDIAFDSKRHYVEHDCRASVATSSGEILVVDCQQTGEEAVFAALASGEFPQNVVLAICPEFQEFVVEEGSS